MSNPEESTRLLKDKYSLHASDEVATAAERTKARTGYVVPQHPLARIQNYLDRFHEIIDQTDPHRREHALELLKSKFHHKYVVKPAEIPESYFDNQKRLAREQGHGDIEITPELRSQLAEVIIADQTSSLDKWINYLSSPDAPYPDALKYWVLRSVLKMAEYDKAKKAYPQRSNGTTKPFPDLNREALAYVIDAVDKKYTSTGANRADEDTDPEFAKLLKANNFAALYAFAIEKITPVDAEGLANIQGQWVKYDQGSDHMPLVTSLQGHGTGWCIAGESTAETFLQQGAFYVYYSHDADGNPTVPRVTIRMQGNRIAEVRGIAYEQNLDPYVSDLVEQKLAEFPDGKEYQQKVADMKLMTAIESKCNSRQALDRDDLRFLYEIDRPIQGFGYLPDPRIQEILDTRDIHQDLSISTGYPAEQISINSREALTGNILYHHGNLNLGSLESAEGLVLPQSIGGYLSLYSLTSAEGLVLPQSIGGDLDLSRLTSAEGLVLPQSIGGNLDLSRLASAEGLVLPQSIGGNLNLGSLESAEGLVLPQSIGGYLNLSRLTSAEGLVLPQSIGGNLDLSRLTSAEGLVLPQSIGGNLNLGSLESAEGLVLPQSIGGYLNLGSLKSAEGLVLPQSIGGYLSLYGLTSAEGLVLPQSIGGNLDLSRLTSADKKALSAKYPNLRII